MNDTKRLGRPRKFDTEEALTAAMHTFWTKGYNGTSMKDLARAMGVSGPSIYAAFGDKRELYLKTIDLYSDADGCEPIVQLEAEEDISLAVTGFLKAVIIYSTEATYGAKGCFLASCVSTSIGEVEGVDARMDKSIKDTDLRLAARFDKEIAKGTLPKDFPSMERARLIYDLRQGYVFRGRAGASANELLQDIDARVQMILTYPMA